MTCDDIVVVVVVVVLTFFLLINFSIALRCLVKEEEKKWCSDEIHLAAAQKRYRVFTVGE